MNLAIFIAKRIAFNKQQSFSRFIIRLSVTATALSVAAMIITMASLNGFQNTISQKVFSFWGHIRVQHYETTKSLVSEETAIEKNKAVLDIIKKQKEVKSVNTFSTKSVVLQHNKEVEGLLFKGIESSYDSNQIKQFIKQGNWINFNDSLYSRDIIVSTTIAEQLQLKLNDTLTVFFIDANQQKSTYRKLRVAALYKTGIEEYDTHFAIGDARLVRRLSNWTDDAIGGYEIVLKDYTLMDTANQKLLGELPDIWMSRTIKEVFPNIFDWLNIMDTNRNVIFVVMAIVAIINLITCLLILVLERTRMVGVLKAMGANNWTIQKIFLYHASIITLSGVGIGLFIGIGICLFQQYTGFITMDEASYYVSVAPIQIIWWQVALICIATAFVCFISLIIPTLLIKNVKPVKAIQFR